MFEALAQSASMLRRVVLRVGVCSAANPAFVLPEALVPPCAGLVQYGGEAALLFLACGTTASADCTDIARMCLSWRLPNMIKAEHSDGLK